MIAKNNWSSVTTPPMRGGPDYLAKYRNLRQSAETLDNTPKDKEREAGLVLVTQGNDTFQADMGHQRYSQEKVVHQYASEDFVNEITHVVDFQEISAQLVMVRESGRGVIRDQSEFGDRTATQPAQGGYDRTFKVDLSSGALIAADPFADDWFVAPR